MTDMQELKKKVMRIYYLNESIDSHESLRQAIEDVLIFIRTDAERVVSALNDLEVKEKRIKELERKTPLSV